MNFLLKSKCNNPEKKPIKSSSIFVFHTWHALLIGFLVSLVAFSTNITLANIYHNWIGLNDTLGRNFILNPFGRMALVVSIELGYVPFAAYYSHHVIQNDLLSLKQAFYAPDQVLIEYRNKLEKIPVKSLFIAISIGVIVGLSIIPLTTNNHEIFEINNIKGNTAWSIIMNSLLFGCYGVWAYNSMRQIIIIRELSSYLLPVNLCDLNPLLGYFQHGIRLAFLWMTSLSIALLLLANEGFRLPIGVLIGVSIIVGAPIFLSPMNDIRRMIIVSKEQTLQQIRSRISKIGTDIVYNEYEIKYNAKECLDMLYSYEKWINSRPEWLFNRKIPGSFIILAIMPIVSTTLSEFVSEFIKSFLLR